MSLRPRFFLATLSGALGWFLLPLSLLGVIEIAMLLGERTYSVPLLIWIPVLLGAAALIVVPLRAVHGRRILSVAAALVLAICAHGFLVVGPRFVVIHVVQTGTCAAQMEVGVQDARYFKVPASKGGRTLRLRRVERGEEELTLALTTADGSFASSFHYLMGFSEYVHVVLDGCNVRKTMGTLLL